MARLSYAQALSVADEIASEMVELLELGNGSVVLLCDTAEVVAGADFVINSSGFRFGRLLLDLLLFRSWIRCGNVVAGHEHRVVLELEVVEVDQLVGVDVHAEVADFKVQMGAVGASGVAAESDDIASLHDLAGVDQSAGKVCVVRLQAVVVADDDEVAVATGVAAFGDADHAVPCRGDGRADGISEVDAAVHSAAAPAVIGGLLIVGGMMISVQNQCVTGGRTHVFVVNADDVEILVQTISRHPVEIGKQHAIAMVDIVEKVRIFLNAKHIPQ